MSSVHKMVKHTLKSLQQMLQPATLFKKRLWHRCFPANFAKFLRTPFLTEHLRWLLPIKDLRNKSRNMRNRKMCHIALFTSSTLLAHCFNENWIMNWVLKLSSSNNFWGTSLLGWKSILMNVLCSSLMSRRWWPCQSSCKFRSRNLMSPN